MKETEKVQKYRDDQVLQLIEAHKDIIAKTWKLIEQDVLEVELDKAGERKNSSESQFWEKLNKRRKGLDAVETSLEKIEKLEKTLSDYKEKPAGAEPGNPEPNGVMVHPSKRHAKT